MTTRRPPAIGAGVGDGMAGAQLIAGIVVSPRHWAVSTPPFFITVSLVEATFFISVAFMALFVFATPGKWAGPAIISGKGIEYRRCMRLRQRKV